MADSEDYDNEEMKISSSPDRPLHEVLRHDSKEHGRLLSELVDMIRSSQSHIEQRYEDWDQVDKYMRLYMDPDAKKRLADRTYDKDAKQLPFKGAIIMPVLYTILMTRAAHKFSQLTATEPRIHYEPVDSDDFIGSRVHEVIARYDLRQSRFDLKQWQAIMDHERYGLAIWYDTFEEKYGYKAQQGMSPLEAMLLGVDLSQPVWTRLKEWNNIAGIDPRNYLPDPDVPIADPQLGNYVGHTDYTNILWYLERKLEDRTGPFFNCKEMRRLSEEQATNRNSDGRWMDGDYGGSQARRKYPNPPVHHIQWKIIPRDWGLANRDKPEIWWFSVYDQHLIIRAHPSVYQHGEFTYCISVPDIDLHAPFIPGMGQQLLGGQDACDWFTNSHMINAKKIINDMVIYNDDLINPLDMANPEPAKHIRLTRRGKRLQEMGGMRIQDMYSQFAITDITQQHINTFQLIFTMLQRMGSTPDTVQGMPLPTKRTLGEVEGVGQNALLRLGVEAQLQDLMMMEPFARRLIQNRQQFTTEERVYRLTGRLIEQLGGPEKKQMFKIRPDDLEGEYDYIPHTATMAPDPARMTAIWGQLLTMLAQAPQLMNPDMEGKVLNPIAVFDEFVRSAGINYLDQFKIQVPEQMLGAMGGALPGQLPPEAQTGASQPGVDVMDEEAIDKQVQSGNLIPI